MECYIEYEQDEEFCRVYGTYESCSTLYSLLIKLNKETTFSFKIAIYTIDGRCLFSNSIEYTDDSSVETIKL